ncbi:MAG: rod shape-determining protein MreC [Oscillospiraceae bacterium]|nr:rod shape-determining protein MreC [Oscillospiraceae bacterium]
MRKRFFTKRVKMILAVAAALTVLVTLGAAVGRGIGAGQSLTMTLLTPLRNTVAAFDRAAERIYGYIFRYEALLAENEELKKALAENADNARVAESAQRENQRLRELLALSETHPDYTLLDAYITARSVSTWENTLTIDKGSAAGLEIGMCAVTGTGRVVGCISSVGTGWAVITTILDADSEMGAVVVSSGNTGVVCGGRQEDGGVGMTMKYLSSGAVVKNGDSIVTTGSDSYPRGLFIGSVSGTGIDEAGVSRYAVIEPGIRPGELEQIFLITQFEH